MAFIIHNSSRKDTGSFLPFDNGDCIPHRIRLIWVHLTSKTKDLSKDGIRKCKNDCHREEDFHTSYYKKTLPCLNKPTEQQIRVY